MSFEPKMITVHHTGNSFSGWQFDIVNRDHYGKSFPKSSMGKYCGYHFFIEKDGAEIQARATNEIGAHSLSYNDNNIGVCLAGNFNVEKPTKEQEEALGKRLTILMKDFNIGILQVYPHRYFNNTSCYGTMLNDKWARLVAVRYSLNLILKLWTYFLVKMKGV